MSKENLFSIGDMVDIKNRYDLPGYGTITHINDNKATVHFRLPRRSPTKSSFDFCEKCGWPGGLSINGGSGELVCLHPGCGHKYGFEDRDEIIPLTKLINISTKHRVKEKQKLIKTLKQFRDEVETIIDKSVKTKVITKNEAADVFKNFQNL